MRNLESLISYDYTKPNGKCPSESVLKAPGKGQILETAVGNTLLSLFEVKYENNGIKWGLGHSGPPAAAETFLKNAGFHFNTPQIRQQKILTFNPDISSQFGTKSQIASYYPVNREGRRIPDFNNSLPKFKLKNYLIF
jgi:hypothetical protein